MVIPDRIAFGRSRSRHQHANHGRSEYNRRRVALVAARCDRAALRSAGRGARSPSAVAATDAQNGQRLRDRVTPLGSRGAPMMRDTSLAFGVKNGFLVEIRPALVLQSRPNELEVVSFAGRHSLEENLKIGKGDEVLYADFVWLVAGMRRCQTRYFRTRQRTHLQEATDAERRVDNAVREFVQRSQKGLFDSSGSEESPQ